MRNVQLTGHPARTDLSDRECSKIIGGLLGVLLQMAEPEDVRRAVTWWSEHDDAWEFLITGTAKLRKVLGLPPFARGEGAPK